VNWRDATVFVGSRVVAVTALGAVLGWFAGSWLVGIAAGLALAFAWQLFHLFWLDSWLQERGRIAPPDPTGSWGEVVSRVVRLYRRKSFHKERLLELLRELRRSTAAMPDGVLVLNANLEIVWFNRMAASMLNLRRPADLRLRVTNLLRDPQLARYLAQEVFDEPFQLAPSSGSATRLALQVIPYGSNQRLMLVRDVSRQFALEAMRKDFVANASHELRTPLTVITGYTETMLHDTSADDPTRPLLAEVHRQVGRMNSIVRDLLELSRLDSPSGEVVGESIDVAAICALLCKDHQANGGLPKIQLQLETTATLMGDFAEIYSAWSNLVGNAAKYTPPTGLVRLIWRLAPSGEGQFSVEDTGPGIAAEHLSRLTERFFRVDTARSRNSGGTGLGLAIVKHVLQHHGAHLEISSVLGKGSRFCCVFPLRRVLNQSGKVMMQSDTVEPTAEILG
jgi:two-component system, OmpR family, phosphate regulon sensor histidine kinase PhoR